MTMVPQGNGVVHGCMLVIDVVYIQVHLVRNERSRRLRYTVGTVRSDMVHYSAVALVLH